VTPTREPVVIEGAGRTWFNYVLYVFFATGAVLIITSVYLILAAPGLLIYDIVWALLGVVSVIVGIGYFDRIPRALTVGPDGIEIRYLLTRARVAWSQLKGPVYQRQGFLDFQAASGTHGVWGALTVTTEQARAILSNPSCPRFDLSPNVVDELDRSV
jgi:hypothetical protein